MNESNDMQSNSVSLLKNLVVFNDDCLIITTKVIESEQIEIWIISILQKNYVGFISPES